MKVYFYHTQNIQYCLKRMADGEFPSHFLYGACHLGDSGIDVVWHKSPHREHSRVLTAMLTAWRVLTCREHIDAVYGTHYKGMELLILLRALHLYRKPIVVWHHQPIVTPSSRVREWGGRLFYRGMDRLIFFSQKLVNDSMQSPKADPARMVVGHWGADLEFYDRIRQQTARSVDVRADVGQGVCEARQPFVFIATGKEQRDQATLIGSFNRSGLPLKLYIGINPNPHVHNPNLDAVRSCHPSSNIDVHEICGLLPYEIALDVARASCVAICCKPTRYTAGLTTVVEALALGLPIVCSRNPQIPVDFDKEGCGMSVEYGDVDGWQRATEYLASHPDEARRMGERGRAIAEQRFNDRQCAREVAQTIRQACADNDRNTLASRLLRIPPRPLNIILSVIVALLLVLCVRSVWTPVRFGKERAARETVVKQRLLLVRAAAERYRHEHGAYTGRLQALVDGGYLADSLQYIPYTKARKFHLAASSVVTRSGKTQPVMECSATYSDYLCGLDADAVAELNAAAGMSGRFPGLKIGDLDAPNDNNGNWE